MPVTEVISGMLEPAGLSCNESEHRSCGSEVRQIIRAPELRERSSSDNPSTGATGAESVR
ncbi:hypothetical protein [Mogibacterium timidum]|uniref:hypothetical protein n=1 Tax=Mogibacterium timidum TaxID=35519 RepID=UPI00248BF2BB|nr:hypothetical protein [Mogibacterium timidum]